MTSNTGSSIVKVSGTQVSLEEGLIAFFAMVILMLIVLP